MVQPGGNAPDAAFAVADIIAKEVQSTIKQAVRDHIIPAAADLARSYVRQEFLHRAGFTTPPPAVLQPHMTATTTSNPLKSTAEGALAAASKAPAPAPVVAMAPGPAGSAAGPAPGLVAAPGPAALAPSGAGP